MYHSITFYHDAYDSPARNTWNNWHLVPTTRPVFNPPALKRKTLDIPGKDGLIDLSESLTGYPVFQEREGSMEFIVMNDYWEWQEAYSTISDFLHGQKLRAILEDDPEYYYEGRFTVSQWNSDKNYSLITIDYHVEPYKRKTEVSEIVMDIPLRSSMRPYWKIRNSFYGKAPTCPELKIRTTDNVPVSLLYLLIDPRNNMEDLASFTKENVTNGTRTIPELILCGERTYLLAVFEGDTVLDMTDSSGDDISDSSGNPLGGTPSGYLTVRCHYGRL